MSEPIFKSVFANSWDGLPIVMKNHYANRPYSNDIVVAKGLMEISFGRIFKFFAPIFRYLNLLAPTQGKNIKTTVTFSSQPNSTVFCFNRNFDFGEGKNIQFNSKMFPIKDNQIVEVMSCNIGWRCAYLFENNKVILRHLGYNLYLFGFFIPLPISLLVGEGYAEEEALSDDEFKMKMVIKHFIFGVIYEYKGQFKITKISQ